ncbi:14169_t:CDS:2, partial [Cetraspora pellucida]
MQVSNKTLEDDAFKTSVNAIPKANVNVTLKAIVNVTCKKNITCKKSVTHKKNNTSKKMSPLIKMMSPRKMASSRILLLQNHVSCTALVECNHNILENDTQKKTDTKINPRKNKNLEMKHEKNKCVKCNGFKILNSNMLCVRCRPNQERFDKCTGCNKKKLLIFENKLCTTCYYNAQFQNVSSGNQDIDNLIKATHSNQPRFRLSWIPFNEFIDIKRIGTGGFSEIYTATWTKGIVRGWSKSKEEFNRIENVTVVLKVLKNSSTIDSAFLKELQSIVKSQTNHINYHLIQCYGATKCPNTNNYVFVMSYMSHGSLNEYLSNNFVNITWPMKREFLRNIVAGIKWIHENRIIHRDIHDGNILINNKNLKRNESESFVADLGFSRPAKEDLENSEFKIYGIMPFVAPEVLSKKPYSFSSDIYSLGIIMWVLTTGRRPFCDQAYDAHLMFNICDGSRPDITEDTPQCWATLMQKCWHSDPLKRPSINEIDHEINFKYWKIDENFIEAENKRQELFKSGKFIVRNMHPHSKTHSQLLNPTINVMLSGLIRGSISSASSSIDTLHSIGNSYSFNIIGTNDLSTSISLSVSKKHTIEFLLANKNETKRRKLVNNESNTKIIDLRTNSYQTIGQEVPNSQTNNLSVSDALKQITTLSDLSFNDMLNYEAGIALSKTLNMDLTLKYLDLSSKNLRNGSGKALAETLCNNITLTSLNLEKNHLADEAGKALAKALQINTTLTYLSFHFMN